MSPNVRQTHPWRFRDARTGGLVVEYVAARGPRLLQLTDTGAAEAEPAGSSAQGRGARQSQASDSPATRTGSGSPHAMDDVYADEDGKPAVRWGGLLTMTVAVALWGSVLACCGTKAMRPTWLLARGRRPNPHQAAARAR